MRPSKSIHAWLSHQLAPDTRELCRGQKSGSGRKNCPSSPQKSEKEHMFVCFQPLSPGKEWFAVKANSNRACLQPTGVLYVNSEVLSSVSCHTDLPCLHQCMASSAFPLGQLGPNQLSLAEVKNRGVLWHGTL